MTIQERFTTLFPKAKVYWNGKTNQLSLHFINCNIDVNLTQTKVYQELSKMGLLRAVESVRILNY